MRHFTEVHKLVTLCPPLEALLLKDPWAHFVQQALHIFLDSVSNCLISLFVYHLHKFATHKIGLFVGMWDNLFSFKLVIKGHCA